MKKINLTSKKLQLIIAEEKAKLKSLGLIQEESDKCSNLSKISNKINAFKKLGKKEEQLKLNLRKLQEIKRKLAKSIIKSNGS